MWPPHSDVTSYDNVPIPGDSHPDLLVDGWFNAAWWVRRGVAGPVCVDALQAVL